MSEDARRILEMLSEKKITVEEAQDLLRAIEAPRAAAAGASASAETGEADASKQRPRWLRVVVHKTSTGATQDKEVNIRIPIALVRGGMRLGAILPSFAGSSVAEKLREQGIDLGKMARSTADCDELDSLLRNLGDLTIDVDQGKARVRLTCE